MLCALCYPGTSRGLSCLCRTQCGQRRFCGLRRPRLARTNSAARHPESSRQSIIAVSCGLLQTASSFLTSSGVKAGRIRLLGRGNFTLCTGEVVISSSLTAKFRNARTMRAIVACVSSDSSRSCISTNSAGKCVGVTSVRLLTLCSCR